jgi:outer membrane lipoprotein-sorting protein
MSFPDPRIAKVRISKDASLGATMSKMRIWFDKQKIQPARWDAMVDAKGFIVTIAFHRDDESQLSRQQFAVNEP